MKLLTLVFACLLLSAHAKQGELLVYVKHRAQASIQLQYFSIDLYPQAMRRSTLCTITRGTTPPS